MKNFLNFFLLSFNHSNTTLFDVFEKVFSNVTMRSSVFCDLILAVKEARFFATLKKFFNFFSATLTHLNRTVSDLL